MKELVILSGKGGTGKTSVAVSFAILAQQAVLADCDVDAADMAQVLIPTHSEKHSFFAGQMAEIRPDVCTSCGACMRLCRFDAIAMTRDAKNRATFSVNPLACEGCGVCARFCPRQAIDLHEARRGSWMISDTRAGPLVHAELLPGADVSGKLVAEVRNYARRRAELENSDLVIIDGPPGIGCPVHAAMNHASLVLLVTEPTAAGRHDLRRIADLAKSFRLDIAVCINRWDVDPGLADQITAEARDFGARFVRRIRFDPAVTDAQMQGRTAVETDSPVAADLQDLWLQTEAFLYREKATC